MIIYSKIKAEIDAYRDACRDRRPGQKVCYPSIPFRFERGRPPLNITYAECIVILGLGL
jgi:hypothetical protein